MGGNFQTIETLIRRLVRRRLKRVSTVRLCPKKDARLIRVNVCLEKITFLVISGCPRRYNSGVAMTSSGLVEFYITK